MKHRWVYNLIVIGLVTYFGVSAALSLWRARLEVNLDPSATEVKASIKKPAKIPPAENYNVIVERNLFGGSKGEILPTTEEVSLEGIPVAKKGHGLKLVGTVVTAKPEENLAFIQTRSSKQEEAYREGDRVEKARIKKILRNNVIINTGRGDEVLTMEPEKDSKGSPAPKKPVRRRRRPARGAGGAIRLEREEIESSMADLNQLMQQVRVRPYMEGRKPAGFVVSNIKPGSLFSKMGLRNGDVIKGVNDEAITSPEQAIELYESLIEGGDIALEIKRGRRSQELRYEIE